eukprot:3980062-Prymnesium_polylepis.2
MLCSMLATWLWRFSSNTLSSTALLSRAMTALLIRCWNLKGSSKRTSAAGVQAISTNMPASASTTFPGRGASEDSAPCSATTRAANADTAVPLERCGRAGA